MHTNEALMELESFLPAVKDTHLKIKKSDESFIILIDFPVNFAVILSSVTVLFGKVTPEDRQSSCVCTCNHPFMLIIC